MGQTGNIRKKRNLQPKFLMSIFNILSALCIGEKRHI